MKRALHARETLGMSDAGTKVKGFEIRMGHLVNTIELAAAGCVETRERSPRMKLGSRRLPLKLGLEATAETKGTQSPTEKLAKRPLSL